MGEESKQLKSTGNNIDEYDEYKEYVQYTDYINKLIESIGNDTSKIDKNIVYELVMAKEKYLEVIRTHKSDDLVTLCKHSLENVCHLLLVLNNSGKMQEVLERNVTDVRKFDKFKYMYKETVFNGNTSGEPDENEVTPLSVYMVDYLRRKIPVLIMIIVMIAFVRSAPVLVTSMYETVSGETVSGFDSQTEVETVVEDKSNDEDDSTVESKKSDKLNEILNSKFEASNVEVLDNIQTVMQALLSCLTMIMWCYALLGMIIDIIYITFSENAVAKKMLGDTKLVSQTAKECLERTDEIKKIKINPKDRIERNIKVLDSIVKLYPDNKKLSTLLNKAKKEKDVNKLLTLAVRIEIELDKELELENISLI